MSKKREFMNYDTPILMHCPNCKSNHLRSFAEPKRFCCGRKPLPYYEWECLDCGARFPDSIKFDISISQLSTLRYVFLLFLFYFSISSVQIYIHSLTDQEMLYALIVSIPAALLCLLVIIISKIRIQKLIKDRDILITNCYT